jgi:hypothetical protein
VHTELLQRTWKFNSGLFTFLKPVSVKSIIILFLHSRLGAAYLSSVNEGLQLKMCMNFLLPVGVLWVLNLLDSVSKGTLQIVNLLVI